MIIGKQIHELIDKYLITPADLGKEIGKKDYDDMANEINLLTEFPSDCGHETLMKAVAIIKQWHGDEVFEIYYEKSPEMAPIRKILGNKVPADL